jgi:serine/threonine-protein kinase
VKVCAQCGSRYDDDGQYCPADGAQLRVISPPDIVTGTVIDERYRIERRLGSGGMGVVYLANELGLGRQCALKVLRPELLADAEAVARFHREAAEASKIIHSHVVTVYGFKETGAGLTYLAMEYVSGKTLARHMTEVGVLSPRPAARIVWQVANALSAAHELNIVHRDLKPGNIMLTRYREWSDFVKVVDFGLAKAFGTTTSPHITSYGHAIGTPAYMSPEQWLTADVDHRSDLYSLGLLTVTMLSGGLPLDKPTAMISGPRIIDELPANDWPDEVKDVLRKSLQLDPRQRFQSAREFAAAFVSAIDRWIPSNPAIREPWDPKIQLQLAKPVAASAVPRVATKPEPPPTFHEVAKKSRPWRYVAGALAIGLMAAAGYWLVTRRATDPVVMNGAAQDSTAPTSTSEPIEGRGQTSSGTTPVPRTPVPGAPSAEKAAAPENGLSLPASIQRLEALLDLDSTPEDSVRLAIDIASKLLQRTLADSARVVLTYRMAEGLLLLGNDSTACARLRGIRPGAEVSGTFVRSIDALLERHCAPR